AGDDHRAVGRDEVLPRAVDDAPHALLNGVVLRVHAVDPGVGLRLLQIAVDEPVVVPVGHLAEAGDLLAAPVGRLMRVPVLDRPVQAVVPVPDHVVLVVHRDPEVAGDLLAPLARLRGLARPDLRPGHDEVVAADPASLPAARTGPTIKEAVIGFVHFQFGCAGGHPVAAGAHRAAGVGGQ